MVSRRKILSRSRDDLNLDQTFSPQEEEEDVWYQKDKLYKEHIQEVLDKWTQIDDEIWAKVIVFERNRRVAKAYARAPVLTINGSDDGFDGMRFELPILAAASNQNSKSVFNSIGLCGFDNPMRDQKTEEFKRHIGQGVKIKMDDAGNILIRRYAKSNVYVKSTASTANEETSIGADIMKLPNQALEMEKIVKLFDMKKFQSNVNRELRRAYPDRRRLETQCLSAVGFVKSESDILECPIWVLIVNVVAMDMLKSKLPPVVAVQRPMVDIKNRPRIPIPDEDPYSVAGNGSGGSSGSSGFGNGNGHQQQQLSQSQQQQLADVIVHNGKGGVNGGVMAANMHLNNGSSNITGHVAATREQLLLQTQQLAHKRSEKPPKLPPRDNIYSHDLIPKPDYDDIDLETRIKLSRGKSDKGKDNKKYDDPYYCGLRARVPNFVKSSKSSKEHALNGHNNNNNNNNITNNNNNNNMGTLTHTKKTSMIHMPLASASAMHPALHAPPPPHMHPHHIQQQQLMAIAAAQAMHHPAAAAHHHQAQQQQHLQQQHQQHHQMWQTRSYESGIGIYSQMSATSATNFILDQATTHQQQQQPQSLPALLTATETATATTTATASNATTTATANALTTTSTATPTNETLALAAAATGPVPLTDTGAGLDMALVTRVNALTKPLCQTLQQHTQQQQYQQQQQQHRHHHHRHHARHCVHRAHDPIYYRRQQQLDAYALESNRPPRRSSQPPPHAARIDDALHKSVSPRRANSGIAAAQSIGSGCNCVSCYTLAPLFGAVPPARPPRSLSQQQLRQHQRLSGGLRDPPSHMSAAVGGNAPQRWCSESDISELERSYDGDDVDVDVAARDDGFGDTTFYELDLELDLESPYMRQPLTPRRATNRRRQTAQSTAASFRHNNMHNNNKDNRFRRRQTQPQTQYQMYRHIADAGSHFDDQDANDDDDDVAAAAAAAASVGINIGNNDVDMTMQLTDSYVDARAATHLRQRQSPTRQRKHKGNRAAATSGNFWASRNKSLSIESFFEQPTEQGTLYMYGGRRRVPKAPSTTNIYDRVRNSLNEEDEGERYTNLRHQSQLNLNAYGGGGGGNNNIQSNNNFHNYRARRRLTDDGVGNYAVQQPMLPSPCWQRAGRRNDFGQRQYNNNNNVNNNNNNKAKNKNNRNEFKNSNNKNNMSNMSAKQSNCDKGQQQQQQLNNETHKQQLQQQQTDSNATFNVAQTALTTATHEQQQLQQQQQQKLRQQTSSNIDCNNNNKSNHTTDHNNNNNNNKPLKTAQQQQLEQTQQQLQQQQRSSRPSRVDISDMESIYGYLKPRKPRSLSLKKIQILDY